MKIRDIKGCKFGDLTVLDRIGSNKNGQSVWLCLCQCGNETTATIGRLHTGHTKSCGCLRKKGSSKKHGGSKMPEYHIWSNIKDRCKNTGNKSYKYYGGRGISIFYDWANSFEQFLKDVGVRPSPKHSLDRIDNDGNYEPGNVRWATKIQQMNNKRNNRYIECNGEVKTISEWSAVSGNSHSKIWSRIRNGWGSENAIFGKSNITATSISEISKYLVF